MRISALAVVVFVIQSSGPIASAKAADGNTAMSDNRSTCQVTVVGTHDGPDALQSANVHCTQASGVSLAVDQIVEPFISSFTGDHTLGSNLGAHTRSKGTGVT